MTAHGVVAAGHELTARAAELVLRAGGNAFDAILAAMCAACATEPELCSLGGGGYLLARPAAGRPRVYDFFVHTPRVKRPVNELDFIQIFADFGTARQEFHIGLGSIATPGVIKGLFDIHDDLGYMPMREITAPAIGYARNGVRVDPLHAYIFGVVGPICMHTPDSRAIYGSPRDRKQLIGEGEELRQPQLADTLEILAIEGADLFYRGEIGRAFTDQCRAAGGHLTLEDLESYAVAPREPLAAGYRGVEIWTNPPPSSGGALLVFALKLLEGVENFGRAPFGSRIHLDLIAQTLDRTARARVEALLDGTAGPDDAVLDGELLQRYRDEIRGRAANLRGTTHISVIDSKENIASLSFSNGEGCGHIIPGTGIMPNNMLGEDDLCPHGFHNWSTDQRMTSMMAPTLACLPDDRILATGSGGSKRIPSALLQLLLNLADYGMSIEQAVESPRVYYEQGLLSVEAGFRSEEIELLLEDYTEHELWGEQNLFFGGTHSVVVRRNVFGGAGDPRRSGACVVVK